MAKNRNIQAVTLVSLVITIVILIIIAGVVLYISLENNGIFNRAKESKELTNKQSATEILNLKITSYELDIYSKQERMPTLQELADKLYEDNEIEYVEIKSQKTASKNKIEVGENQSIFTKLQSYTYEFEIGRDLQILKIDGIEISKLEMSKNNTVTLTNEEYSNLLKRIKLLEENEKCSSNIYYLGIGNSFDLNKLKEEGKLPENLNLNEITIDNFIVGISAVTSGQTVNNEQNHWSRAYIYGDSISKSYNQDLKILNISNSMILRSLATWNQGQTTTYKDAKLNNPTFAYLIIGTIENM